jgi:UDP-glucuronate 4-epimerase
VLNVNLVGLANTLGAAAQSGVKRFVYTGSIATFGPDTPDGGLLEEDTPHDPRTLYAITKSAGDAVVQRLGDLHDLDWVIARLGRVFGPYEHDTSVRDTMSQIYQVNEHARAGRAVHLDRPCIKNWSYAPDTAADLDVLLTAPSLPHRVYNLGAPHAWSLADWCERLASRHKGFRYSVGGDAEGADTVDLWGAKDGSLLSWQRFEADFARPTPHDLDTAFDDYMRFLGQDYIVGSPS